MTPLIVDLKRNDVNTTSIIKYLTNYAEKYDDVNEILDSINNWSEYEYNEFGIYFATRPG